MKKNKFVYLKNYVTPSYLVKHVILDFNIDKKKTVLKSKFTLQANTIHNKRVDLILDGKKIRLKKLSINRRKINFKSIIFKKDLMIIPKNLIDSQNFTIEMECFSYTFFNSFRFVQTRKSPSNKSKIQSTRF